MHGDHGRSQCSLKVGAHDFLKPIDLRELGEGRSIRLWSALSVGAQSLDGNVQANLVPVRKAIGDRLLRQVDPHRNIVD